MCFHGRLLLEGSALEETFQNAWIVVEFFFVVFGYLMVASVVRKEQHTPAKQAAKLPEKCTNLFVIKNN